MAIPTFDSAFAEVVSLPKKVQLCRWLIKVKGSGVVDDFYTLPNRYLYAKIAVAYGCPLDEASYISQPIIYTINAIYRKVAGSSDNGLLFDDMKTGLGAVVAAIRGDQDISDRLGFYIDLPEKYQLALAATS